MTAPIAPARGEPCGGPGRRLSSAAGCAEEKERARWRALVFMWGLFLLLTMTVGRESAYTQPIIWGGAGLIALRTLVVWLRARPVLPREWRYFAVFLAWALLGGINVQDSNLFFRYLSLAAEFAAVVVLLGLAISRAGTSRWLWIAFIAATLYNLRAETTRETRAAVQLLDARNEQRVEGKTTNPNALGYLAFGGSFGALVLAGEVKRKVWWVPIGMAWAICTFVVVLTASRGALMVTAISVVLWLWRGLPLLMRVRGASVLAFGIVAFGLYQVGRYIGEETYVGTRIVKGTEGKDESANVRGTLISIAIRIATENPIAGVGLGQFPIASGTGLYAHNEVAELIATTGFVGAALYYVVYWRAWRRLWRVLKAPLRPRERYAAEMARILLIAVFVSGVTFRQNFLAVDSFFLFGIAVGMSCRLEEQVRRLLVSTAGWRQSTRSARVRLIAAGIDVAGAADDLRVGKGQSPGGPAPRQEARLGWLPGGREG